jgi:hypothetical protein
MYYSKILNRIKLVCFLDELNFEMVKSEMIVLTERDKTDANSL